MQAYLIIDNHNNIIEGYFSPIEAQTRCDELNYEARYNSRSFSLTHIFIK